MQVNIIDKFNIYNNIQDLIKRLSQSIKDDFKEDSFYDFVLTLHNEIQLELKELILIDYKNFYIITLSSSIEFLIIKLTHVIDIFDSLLEDEYGFILSMRERLKSFQIRLNSYMESF